MPLPRRRLLSLAAMSLGMASCGKGEGPVLSVSPSSSPTTSTVPVVSPTPSASSSAEADLTRPGEARKVVDALVAWARLPVIKLDITRTTATLSCLDAQKKVAAWRWESGGITKVASDIEYIQQASFDPKDFDLQDVGALFRAAAEVSGSSSGQELQIVEQTPGSIQMVVTTRPESEAVFFRPDGSLVRRLDLHTRPGLEEGLKDAVAGRTQLTRVELARDLIYAESADPKNSSATLRITRPEKVPAYRTSRAEAPTMASFSPTDIPLDVLVSHMESLPARLEQPEGTAVTWVIDCRDGRPLPTVRFTVGSRTIVTDLSGRDITTEV
ncbi:hypothetical protein M3G03_04655 [Aestuariimicrobium sp. p3-SID1156]|uniref:hypothetical protein n=1 Tax=Aestuariimicrobium sp. p3-SID1156 TaxID=2916038 RepID=UPI00223B60BB|nr:hypothetical protein [Aestuariimicrobium sp. p3-SID1156]MCT1458833.1 hypothetical protein [Aestuariimicrobium sp. p3-SID1156]